MSPERLPFIILCGTKEEIGLDHIDIAVAYNNLFKQFFICAITYHPRKIPAIENHNDAFMSLPYKYFCIPCADQKLIKNLIRWERKRGQRSTRYSEQLHLKRVLAKGHNTIKQYLINYLSDAKNCIWIYKSGWNRGTPANTFDIFVRFKRGAISNASFLCEDIDGAKDTFIKVAFREPRNINSKGTAFESFDADKI